MKIFYSDGYYADIGAHPFRMDKFRLIRERLEDDADLSGMVAEPSPARDEDVLLVHTREYVDKLKNGSLSPSEIMRLELPCSVPLVEAAWLWTGGSIMAMNRAVEEGVGINLGGGFHHAFADYGEGFCVLNDIAVGIRRNQGDGLFKKVLVVDCDLHQGNGTAVIFAGDDSVFTFSIHQENNYPFHKPASDLDIGMEDGAGDDEYLGRLSTALPGIVSSFNPDLIVYIAGADPYADDQLGGLSLSIEGLRRRDEFVFSFIKRGVPVAALLAGGYALDVRDTVRIHYNMVMEGLKASKK
ncbi:MAG: histone deacetylase [Candidatus Tritonobacter lacicola]|nr:histone deacetylase [Candidatus Tritonobacter lacicola]